MRFFIRGGERPSQVESGASGGRCPHPIGYRVVLYEEPLPPTSVARVRCTECGRRLYAPQVTAA